MSSPELVIRGQKVFTSNGFGPASIHVRDGKIISIAAFDEVPEGCEVVDAGEMFVTPGLVDTHVHINEPGRTNWEGFRTATRAAAAGGVTTLVEMPLNSIPPTTTLDSLERKLEAAEGQCYVDVGFWGGVVPGNLPELSRLHERGVLGFKCFLVPSGVDEFRHVTETELRPAMRELKRLDALLIVHAETPGPIDDALEKGALVNQADPREFSTFLRARPREAENEAVALVISLSRETGARSHIVHHSSSDALPSLRRAREEGVPITVETCPHYLFFAAEDVPTGATEHKCCPPLRERENMEKLWAALADGIIDMVVSDHSPAPPEMKCLDTGNFMEAWGGISSLQLRLPVMWTLINERELSLAQLVRWTAAAPARLVGLEQRKGALRVGADADIVIWDAGSEFTVEPSMLQHRHKLTPYLNKQLRGLVLVTYLRGEKIYDRGEFAEKPSGAFIMRGDFDVFRRVD